MFFDPKTNFVSNERAQQPRVQPRPMPQQQQQQQQQQPQPNPIQQQSPSSQQPNVQQISNINGPELNERIAQIRLEQKLDEQDDLGIIQRKIEQIQETDPKKIEIQKENEYLEMLKKNPFIKQKYTNSLDQENLKMLVLFNSKHHFDYKLQYYQYFTSQPNINFNVNSYNKYHLEKKESSLKFYLKFSDKEPDYVLVRRSKMFKNYGQLQTSVVDNESPNIIQTKPYRGLYSRQYDYQFFKMQMYSEKVNFTQ